jgi:hypothetical protein
LARGCNGGLNNHSYVHAVLLEGWSAAVEQRGC